LTWFLGDKMKSVMVVVKSVMCEWDKNKEVYVRISYENEIPKYFEDLRAARDWMINEFRYCDIPARMYIDKLDGKSYVVGYIYPHKHKENEDYQEYWLSFYWIEDILFEEDLVDVADE